MITNIRKIGMVLTSVLLFMACAEDLTEKSDYEHNLDPSKKAQITTLDALEIGGLYALLEGTMEATAQDTAIDKGFIISATEAFDNPIVKSVSPVSKNGNYSALILDLPELTTFYYKAYATTYNGGTALGEVKSFTTTEIPTVIASFSSEAFEDEWEVVIQMEAIIGYYKALGLYEEGHDIVLDVAEDGSVTVAKQLAYVDTDYGDTFIRGKGTFDGKVFKLRFIFSDAEGDLGAFNEVLTLP